MSKVYLNSFLWLMAGVALGVLSIEVAFWVLEPHSFEYSPPAPPPGLG